MQTTTDLWRISTSFATNRNTVSKWYWQFLKPLFKNSRLSISSLNYCSGIKLVKVAQNFVGLYKYKADSTSEDNY